MKLVAGFSTDVESPAHESSKVEPDYSQCVKLVAGFSTDVELPAHESSKVEQL